MIWTYISIFLTVAFGIYAIIETSKFKNFKRATALVMKTLKEGTQEAIEDQKNNIFKDKPISCSLLLGRVEEIHNLAKQWLKLYWRAE
jgi:hypothetical protein